jgi:protein disulfide-isomerase A1
VTNFIVGKLDAASMELESMEDFEEVAQAEVAGVLLMSETDLKQIRTFEIFFSSFEDIFFFHSTLPEALKKWTNGSKYNFLVFTQDSPDPKVLSTDQSLSLAEIKFFFDESRFPIVMDLDGPGSDRIFNEKRTTVFLFADKKTTFQQPFLDVALLFQKKGMLFVRTDLRQMMGIRLGEYFLMDLENDHNTIRVIEFREGRPFRYALPKLEEGALIQLLQDITKGKGKPYFKSEPQPTQSTSQPLKKIVGRNFEGLVLQSPESFLLFIVSPDCGHCKQLAPEIDTVAQQFSKDSRVSVGKMDGTLNEIESLEAPGYPLIVFYPASDKENPIPSAGDRNAKAIAAWVEKELQTPRTKVPATDDL